MNLAIITAHAGADSLSDAVHSWVGAAPPSIAVGIPDGGGIQTWDIPGQPPVYIVDGQGGMLQAYQRGFKEAWAFNLLAYLHDDTLILEQGWAERVRAEFEDPQVGVVGFGGSRSHGSPLLYKVPYDISQLSRGEYLSNAEDAEVHGTRYDGPPIDVAVLDGFALIFRRELLVKMGGWPVDRLKFHGYDFYATCMAHRLGFRVRLVPVRCLHLGGKSSVALKLDDGFNHASGHEFIYREFSDVMPYSA